MIVDLRFGLDSSLGFDLPADALVAHCDAPRGKGLFDVAGAVDRALAEPLGFPPLVQAALPGDKVVLALEHAVPQAATVVERIVATLVGGGVAAEDITLVRALADVEAGAPDPLAALPGEVRRAVTGMVHDPLNRGSLSYLAASTEGKPVYINRSIHDADLVISIGCLRLEQSLGYHGIHSAVFPTFSDAANIDRYHRPTAGQGGQGERLARDADEVGWLLGLRFTVQVVPGAAPEILRVLAGDAEAVRREGGRVCAEAWNCLVPRRASFVVATIGGGAEEQTWENVGRALSAVSRAVSEDGALAICTELAQRPGPALQQIIGADNLDKVSRGIRKHHPSDALPAIELVHALQRSKVYLISRLDEELVEELGILPLEAGQLRRLAGQYDSCIVLANAQYAGVLVHGDLPQQPIAGTESRK